MFSIVVADSLCRTKHEILLRVKSVGWRESISIVWTFCGRAAREALRERGRRSDEQGFLWSVVTDQDYSRSERVRSLIDLGRMIARVEVASRGALSSRPRAESERPGGKEGYT